MNALAVRTWLLGAVLAAAPASALDPARALTQYQLDTWRTDKGLPAESVGALARTRDGYLWVGTSQGLARFDGVRFTMAEGTSGSIESLLEDKAGTLWIGTPHGLYRGQSGRIAKAGQGLPEATVASLLADASGRLWVGTRGQGLFRGDGAQVQRVAEETLPGRRIRALAQDASGTVWAGTEKGLYSLGTGDRVRKADGLLDENVFALLVDHDGRLWVGTDGGVQAQRADGGWDTVGRVQGLGKPFVRTLAEDAAGNLWAGTEDGGLARIRNGRARVLDTHAGLPSDGVMALLTDGEGLLWAGTTVGLVRLKDSDVTPLTTREGLPTDDVLTVMEDHRGATWIGTRGGGLARVQDGAVTTFTSRDGLGSDSIDSLAEDTAGTLWVGTYGGGVARFDGRRFTRLAGGGETIYALVGARDGSLWIGTLGEGLYHRSPDGHVAHWGTAEGLPSDRIFSLLEARDGTLWVGTATGPVRLRNRQPIPWPKGAEPPSSTPLTFHERSDGSVWVATADAGLERFAGGRWASVTAAQGLPSDEIAGLLPEGGDRFWLSTPRGLFRVAVAQLDAVASGTSARVDGQRLGIADGMKSPEGNGGSQPSSWAARDGRLWFCTHGGIAIVDPAHVGPESAGEGVSIEDVLADGRRVDDGQVPAGTRTLEVHYTALALASPERARFRYRLGGYDAGWIDAGSRRTAYYSRPPGGAYRFEVMAGESGTAASLPLSVGKAWHERAGVRVLAGLLLLAIAYGGHRLRTWRLQESERALTAQVAARTEELRGANAALARQNTVLADNVRLQEEVERMSRHDLRTPVGGIIGLVRRLRHTPGLEERHLELLRLAEAAGYRLLDLVNLSVDMVRMEKGTYELRPHSLDLVEVARRVARDLEPLAAAAGVAVRLEPGRAIASGEDLLTYSMVANLVKNAVEASPPGAVVAIAFLEEAGRAGVRIRNRGAVPAELRERFFEKFGTAGKAEGTGLGTYSARLMAETQRGRITLETSEESGTTITVLLPAGAGVPEAIVAGPAPEPVAAPSPPTRPEDRTIARNAPWPALGVLIVDDDPINTAILHACLPVPPMRVFSALNGRAGLDVAARVSPEVVFLDLEMPVMGGLEAARLLRERERTSGRRAVLIGFTAHEDPETRQRFLDAGVDHCLMKPAEPEDILRLLRKVRLQGAPK